MTLDDTAGCPGKWLPFRVTHAGICIACDRYRRGGEQIAPAADADKYGVFFCPERRFTGKHSPDASVTAETGAVCSEGRIATPPRLGGCA